MDLQKAALCVQACLRVSQCHYTAAQGEREGEIWRGRKRVLSRNFSNVLTNYVLVFKVSPCL